MAGRTRYALPLDPPLERKFDALAEELDVHVLAAARAGAGADGDPRFHLVRPLPVLDGPLFYLRFPFLVARELRRVRPDAVLVQGAQETALARAGRGLARVPAKVILDLHGDPATPARLYGSPLRRTLAPFADLLARRGIRGADAVRTLSPFTSDLVRRLGVEPAGEFPAFMDLETFLERPPTPLPERPVLLFVGVLERYKAVEVLAEAWRRAAPAIPDATLHLVGRGTMSDVPRRLVAEMPDRVRWTERLSTPEIAAAMDGATALLLPSRSEGLPRIVVEAFCRGRPVVGTRAGGIPDIVSDGENGLLVTPEDPAGLAEAIVRVTTEPALASRLADGARHSAGQWTATPEEYARRTRELVEAVVGR
jgi:glycosyltransferase involved in cell wall biosynthesis